LIDEDLFQKKTTSELKEVVFDVASTSKAHLDHARELSDKITIKNSSNVFLIAVAIDHWLEVLRRLDFDIFDDRWAQSRSPKMQMNMLWHKFRSKY